MHKEDYAEGSTVTKEVDWFAVCGVILGAVTANLVHWGIASINGMAVAAVCYFVGQAANNKSN